MSRTISVSTTMDGPGFHDFAVFDAFHHRKAWLRPAIFSAIMLAFAAVCLSQLGKRPGAGLLAAVLAIVGIGLPASYFYSFFHSVSKQIRQMHLPRAFSAWSWPTPALLCGCTASRTSPSPPTATHGTAFTVPTAQTTLCTSTWKKKRPTY